MIKIIKGRRQGKTTDLIKLSSEMNIYILVADRNRALNIQKQAEKLGLKIPFPVTVAEYFHSGGFWGSFVKQILIDDAEDVLQAVFSSVSITGITLTYD